MLQLPVVSLAAGRDECVFPSVREESHLSRALIFLNFHLLDRLCCSTNSKYASVVITVIMFVERD